MSVRTVVFNDPLAFHQRIAAFLLAREDLHNLPLSLVDRLVMRNAAGRERPPLMVSVEQAGEVAGFALRTPPHKLLISDVDEAVAPVVARDVHARYTSLPAVMGVHASAAAFARAWTELSGQPHEEGMRQALHRLDRLARPEPVSGAAREAHLGDLPLLERWFAGFARESHLPTNITAGELQRKAEVGDMILWEADHRPVAMAGCAGRTPNGGRVGPVYTPPEHRNRGFGTAVTAAATQKLLDEGRRFVVLYTDLANPTSNHIYHTLGYRVIAEVVDVEFGPLGA